MDHVVSDAAASRVSWIATISAPVVTLIVAGLAFFGVLTSASIAYRGIRESNASQRQTAREDRVWTARTVAYTDTLSAVSARYALAERLRDFESYPDIPGSKAERLRLLDELRRSEAALAATLNRARFLGGDGVGRALVDLEGALDEVASSKSFFRGAGTRCWERGDLNNPFGPFGVLGGCTRFVDSSGPLDEQTLTTPFVEDGELEGLTKAIDAFLVETKQEQKTD